MKQYPSPPASTIGSGGVRCGRAELDDDRRGDGGGGTQRRFAFTIGDTRGRCGDGGGGGGGTTTRPL